MFFYLTLILAIWSLVLGFFATLGYICCIELLHWADYKVKLHKIRNDPAKTY